MPDKRVSVQHGEPTVEPATPTTRPLRGTHLFAALEVATGKVTTQTQARHTGADFTPTSASWMNQIETWFGILSRQAIRQGSFRSVKELIAMIDAFTVSWNEGSTPFRWVKTADQILAKAVRPPRAISESGQ
jgi:hypothetical protein